jgi:hypothetical protein
VGATGLATNPTEYRNRLREQADDQLDAWAAELLRDVAARQGVGKALAQLREAARLDDGTIRRIFSRGGGAPDLVGRDHEGRLLVPAVTLHAIVAGMRVELPDARDRLVAYLAAQFDEIVYI